jgi:hypothetical protein
MATTADMRRTALSSRPRIVCLPFRHVRPFPPSGSARTRRCSGRSGRSQRYGPNVLLSILLGIFAVLGSPDEEDLHREAHDYAVLFGQAAVLPIGDAPRSGPAWLLSLKNAWFRCRLTHFGGPLSITDAAEGIVPGMSGSPIVADNGAAIGVVCCSTGAGDEPPTEGSPNARLNYNLPVWLVRASEL